MDMSNDMHTYRWRVKGKNSGLVMIRGCILFIFSPWFDSICSLGLKCHCKSIQGYCLMEQFCPDGRGLFLNDSTPSPPHAQCLKAHWMFSFMRIKMISYSLAFTQTISQSSRSLWNDVLDRDHHHHHHTKGNSLGRTLFIAPVMPRSTEADTLLVFPFICHPSVCHIPLGSDLIHCKCVWKVEQ